MDALARKLQAAGKISDLCEGLGFYQRSVRPCFVYESMGVFVWTTHPHIPIFDYPC